MSDTQIEAATRSSLHANDGAPQMPPHCIRRHLQLRAIAFAPQESRS
jgi:hypothetical protein